MTAQYITVFDTGHCLTAHMIAICCIVIKQAFKTTAYHNSAQIISLIVQFNCDSANRLNHPTSPKQSQ